VIAVLAFVLGGLFLDGGNETASNDHAGHDDASIAAIAPEVWSCSMHPQIKLPKAGKCPICFMDLIPLEADSGSELGPRQLRMSDAAAKLAQVQTAPAMRAFAVAEVRMVGKIAYDESKVAYLTAWVPGRLDRLYADFTGITVKKGDHLVQIYSPELLAAQEELIQAQRAVDALSKTSSPVLRSTAQATVEAVRDKLRLWGLAAEQVERIETTHETTDHLTIYAPIGGVVVHKDAKEGMYVSTGTRIYTIADLSKLWVMFEAYESDLAWLRFGQMVEFTSPAFPGERFEALISFIDPLVDPKTRTVRVRALVDNQNGNLKPDMFVRGTVKAQVDGSGRIVDEYLADKWISPMHPEVVKDGPGQCDVCGMDLVPAASLGYVRSEPGEKGAPLLIPATAPMITGKRAVAYVEVQSDEGLVFEGRQIELGPRAGNYYVVKSGIEEGELVVVNGAFKIDSELQIRAKPSMMSPEGGMSAGGHDHGAPATNAHAGDHSPAQPVVSNQARRVLTPVYDAYFGIQMALANDDLGKSGAAAAEMSTAIDKLDMSVFSRSGHRVWMELSAKMAKQATRVAKAKDITIARDGFFFLSEAAIELHKNFGHADDRTYYLTFCPMARDGDGAYWLQTEDTVWNSFYGESMLRCGSTKEAVMSGAEGDG
jgi:Cu(I)/Ag(I) efflux system membrane fusion protein